MRFTEVDLDAGDDPFDAGQLSGLGEQVRSAGIATLAAAQAGDDKGALVALDQHRLLCGHRRGPYGVLRWSLEVERWLAEAIPGYAEDGEWYVGRPLLVTANDYDMGLFNGDTGVIVAAPDGVRAAFARGDTPALYSPVRLDSIQTVHAMTVHRAQGSQFESVSFVVPPPDSPLLTRELLYTAVTRATDQVHVIGAEAAIRRAVARPANRASGLRNRLAPTERRSDVIKPPDCGRVAPPPDRALVQPSEFSGVSRDQSGAEPSRQASTSRQAIELLPGSPTLPESSFAVSSSRVYQSA